MPQQRVLLVRNGFFAYVIRGSDLYATYVAEGYNEANQQQFDEWLQQLDDAPRPEVSA